MTAFGGYGEYVDRAEEIGPALRRALASGLPACVNVRVDPESPYPR
jgi:Thiamine pyrophosphate-requiring enzymes [acetolactate synthase, pyruvate dehydrogenase (cytochrome), glyoxylate carboligase, phosphonopyruvate decarboxylase]